MILKALYDLAQAENLIDDPDFEYKAISWVVRLLENGALVTIEDLRADVNAGTKRKPKLTGKNELVPIQPVRTSGDYSFFLVDKAEYVFGIDPAGERPAAKLLERARLFRESVEQCAAETHDIGAQAVAHFLKSLADQPDANLLKLHAKDAAPGDQFAFKVGSGTFAHLHPAIRAYWKRQRNQVARPDTSSLRCLITGEPVAEPEGLPLIKRLPGGTPSGVALVSHNAGAFESYGLRGSANAPISRAAAEAAIRALNRLLDPMPIDGRGNKLPRRHVKLSGDTVVVYWSPVPSAQSALDAISGLTEAEAPETVADAYRSVWRGEMPSIDDPAAFYAITLTGTQGRAVVRDWLESNVRDVMRCLARHFADLQIVRNTRPAKGRDLPPALPLRVLMDSLSPPGGDVPAALAAEFVHAALRGTPYPLAVLQKSLLRERAEIGRGEWIDSVRRDARASLIKACLNRRRRASGTIATYTEVHTNMTPENTTPGYKLGALLAVMERLQALALSDVNASVVDRYFAAASATPRVVFDRLLKNARHHARKAADDNAGSVFLLERVLDELIGGFTPQAGGFPSHLSLDEQGLFIIGYHHMRKWLWMNKSERADWEAAHPNVPRAFRWSAQARAEVLTT